MRRIGPESVIQSGLTYASTGPVITLLQIRRKRAARRGSGEGPNPEA